MTMIWAGKVRKIMRWGAHTHACHHLHGYSNSRQHFEQVFHRPAPAARRRAAMLRFLLRMRSSPHIVCGRSSKLLSPGPPSGSRS